MNERMGNMGLDRVSDDVVLAGLHASCVDERQVVAVVIAHLAEVDRRRLYLAQGCASMFAFCTEVLGWSEGMAFRRVRVARAVQLFPGLVDNIADGTLHLSGIVVLAPHLAGAGAGELIAAARGKSKRAIEQLVADHAPRPAASSTVTPLGNERFKIAFTASSEFCAKLEQARDLMSHAVPDRDIPAVIERALEVLLERLRKTKLGQTNAPRPAPASPDAASPGSRHVPFGVKRAVVERDGQRCGFVSAGGRRCSATAFLEFHHEQAFAHGGPTIADNIEMRCAAHNRYQGEQEFPGVAAAVRRRRAAATSPVANDEHDDPTPICDEPVSDGPTHDGPSYDGPTRRDAMSALRNLGFTAKKATAAVTAAASVGTPDTPPSFEQLIRDALSILSAGRRTTVAR
jgi:hypothetical protein